MFSWCLKWYYRFIILQSASLPLLCSPSKYKEKYHLHQERRKGRGRKTKGNREIISSWRDVQLSTYTGWKGFKLWSWDLARNLQIWVHGFIQGLYKVNCFLFQECIALSFPTKLKVLEKLSLSGDRTWDPWV